jgi:hypothetical protein
VAAIGHAQMRDAAAEDADHHRLHDGQREQARDGRVHRVAAGQQHLRPGGGGERVVRADDAPMTGGRVLLAGEHQPTAGRRRSPSVARSKTWPARMASASSKGRPTICAPTGNPSCP